MNWLGSSAIPGSNVTALVRYLQVIISLLMLAACQSGRAEVNAAAISGSAPVVELEGLLVSLNQDGENPLPDKVEMQDTITYRVKQSLRIVNYGPGQPSKHNLWLALVRSIPPYQEVKAVSISPKDYTLVVDEYDNRYAEFSFDGMAPDSQVNIEVDYEITLNKVAYDLDECEGVLPATDIQPELYIESYNPQVQALAKQLTNGEDNVCRHVRAVYDYIGDNLQYTYNGADWGAQAALGEIGADCTEYSSLMVALDRALGIPARYLEGIQLSGSQAGEGARLEHSWVEVYLPGIGWAPFDPTLGRLPATREKYFAGMPADHIIVTVGRNPSTLRGSSYYSHIYWGAEDTRIKVEDFNWEVTTP